MGHAKLTSREAEVEHLVGHLAHYLPAQGPIGVFIHHNTLHAFQHLPFEEAVVEAARFYGTEPYLSEAAFRTHLRKGRIEAQDVDFVLDREPNQSLEGLRLTRSALRRAMLLRGDAPMDAAEVYWWRQAGNAPEAEQKLFAFCEAAMANLSSPAPPAAAARYPLVDAWLIRLAAAYLDQGVSHWPMPDREQGFLKASLRLLVHATAEPFAGLREEAARQLEAGRGATETVILLAERLGGSGEELEPFLEAELMALAGWAGMFHRLEGEPTLAPHEILPCKLMEYLAVRLTLRVCGREVPEPQKSECQTASERAAELYAAVVALHSERFQVEKLEPNALGALCSEVLRFDQFERRRIWQLAFERHHERFVLSPLVRRFSAEPLAAPNGRPSAQVFFCIDEREESLRRHLEELSPSVQTFSAAGFFGVAMDYAGIDDARGVALCPVVVKPVHSIREQVASGHADRHERRLAFRRLWSRFAQSAAKSTRSLWLGWFSTVVLGMLSLFPLLIRVLAPRQYRQLRIWLNELFLPVPRTEVTLMREDQHSHQLNDGLQLGFTTPEKVDRVASVLAPAGLREGHSRLVVVLGHGSTSLNNPHESAYDCGACGGRSGGPNARLFATMANRPSVREGLRTRGIVIPEDTWFVGGLHDTVLDEITLFDLEELPESHRADLAALQAALDKARAANALERCRRFGSAPETEEPLRGLNHVAARGEHLAQPRAECGHATNAVAFVGRRHLLRGLFLDRRWFMVSYDPTLDQSGQQLERLLGAGGPVCAGINLEYYFSYVDNARYGCGSKLPHNITGLIGVMDGYSSDLRTGLPWQMVEIHEPVRILFVVEADPALLSEVVARLPVVEEFVKNRWVRVATVHPQTREISVLRAGGFEPFTESGELPKAASSRDWYRGKHEFLPVAEIEVSA